MAWLAEMWSIEDFLAVLVIPQPRVSKRVWNNDDLQGAQSVFAPAAILRCRFQLPGVEKMGQDGLNMRTCWRTETEQEEKYSIEEGNGFTFIKRRGS